jgi:hypothetical protein
MKLKLMTSWIVIGIGVFLGAGNAFAKNMDGGCKKADNTDSGGCNADGCIHDNFTGTTLKCDKDGSCTRSNKGKLIAVAPGVVARCNLYGSDYFWGQNKDSGTNRKGKVSQAYCDGFNATLPSNAQWFADAANQCWRWSCAAKYMLNDTTKECEEINEAWCLQESSDRFASGYRNYDPSQHKLKINNGTTCSYECATTGYSFTDNTHTACAPCIGADRYPASGVCTLCGESQVVNDSRNNCTAASQYTRAQMKNCWSHIISTDFITCLKTAG